MSAAASAVLLRDGARRLFSGRTARRTLRDGGRPRGHSVRSARADFATQQAHGAPAPVQSAPRGGPACRPPSRAGRGEPGVARRSARGCAEHAFARDGRTGVRTRSPCRGWTPRSTPRPPRHCRWRLLFLHRAPRLISDSHERRVSETEDARVLRPRGNAALGLLCLFHNSYFSLVLALRRRPSVGFDLSVQQRLRVS